MAKRKPQYCYPFPRPALTVDVANFTLNEGQLQLLLIRRKIDPFAGKWALPGGFVNEGEGILAAAHRELREETSVKGMTLHEFGAFGDPGRDPRGWTVSIAFFALMPGSKAPRASDDAEAVGWFPVHALPELAFDHDVIIDRATTALRHRPIRSLARSGCLPRQFDFKQLHEVMETIRGEAVSRLAVLKMMQAERETWRPTKAKQLKRFEFT